MSKFYGEFFGYFEHRVDVFFLLGRLSLSFGMAIVIAAINLPDSFLRGQDIP